MRYLILSDIHANWEALSAVLSHARRKKYEEILFLGDAVGYGASPNAVMDWLRSIGSAGQSIRGNHDRVCSGLDSGEYFNAYALQAVQWTANRLEDRNRKMLQELPEGPLVVEEQLAMCHGTPHDEDAYIFSGKEALQAFDVIPQQAIFFGHTHVPSVFILSHQQSQPDMEVRLLGGERERLSLEHGKRYLINPGSVGQPRDRDPRASYGIYDSQTQRFYHYRVAYPVAEARRRIVRAGLPPMLGDRLLHGV